MFDQSLCEISRGRPGEPLFMNCNKKSHFDGVTPAAHGRGEEGRGGGGGGGFGYVSVCEGGGVLTGLGDGERRGGVKQERRRGRQKFAPVDDVSAREGD